MSLALKIVIGVIALLVLVGIGLRLRKLRRDEMRAIATRVERRLVEPPPSPYTPSKGFRLLDGPLQSLDRPVPARPRLEPDREYVFSESQLPPTYQESVSPIGRHDERWALSKSVHRSRFSSLGSRLALVVLVLAIVAILSTYYLQHGRHPGTTTTTTTTTTLAGSTTSKQSNSTVVWPATLVASEAHGEDATYSLPVDQYRVTVLGTHGPVWTVYQMGPNNTLEWQGKIAENANESLVFKGASQITLGSPGNAQVRVGLSTVVFPSPLPPTLTLILTPKATSSG
jgi:archaellum component FlaF (FlaF/FlaG flagellin family)